MNKMNKLKLEYLAPYLPYGLKVSKIHTLHARQGIGNIYHVIDAVNEGKLQYRPILRPLSDLTKEIDHNGERFVPQSKMSHLDLEWLITSKNLIMKTNYEDVLKLLEWNFDVFGLIDQGLAIDINKL